MFLNTFIGPVANSRRVARPSDTAAKAFPYFAATKVTFFSRRSSAERKVKAGRNPFPYFAAHSLFLLFSNTCFTAVATPPAEHSAKESDGKSCCEVRERSSASLLFLVAELLQLLQELQNSAGTGTHLMFTGLREINKTKSVTPPRKKRIYCTINLSIRSYADSVFRLEI